MTIRLSRTPLLLAATVLALGCHRAAPAPQAVREARRLAFDPADPTRLLVVERGGDVSLWRLDDPAAPRGEQRLAAKATDAQFLPAGAGVVSGDATGRLRRWTSDGESAWVTDAGAPIRSLATCGDRIAAGGGDGRVRLWTPAGTPAGTLPTDADTLLAVAFSPRCDWLAAEGADTQLRLWQRHPQDGSFAPAATFRPVNGQYATLLPNLLRYDLAWGWDRSVAFAPDGQSLLAADFAGNVQRWSLAGEPIGEPFGTRGAQHIRALAVAPDGRVATAVYDGSIQVWPPTGGTPLVRQAHSGVATAVAIAPDGSRLASAGLDGTVVLWRADGVRLGTLPSAK